MKSVFFYQRSLCKVLMVCVLALVLFALADTKVSAATYVVTKTAETNDGICDADCSIREAIGAANANTGADEINFAIPNTDPNYIVVGDYYQLTTTSQLTLTDEAGVFLNGYSQPGASRNTVALGGTLDTVLKIQLRTLTPVVLLSIGGGNNHIAGINMVDTATLVVQVSSSNNWIEGNFIGTDITGMTDYGQGTIQQISGDNNIYGTNGDGVGDRGERNVMMGSSAQYKIGLTTAGNYAVIAGNYLGLNKTSRTCGTAGQGRSAVTVLGTAVGTRVGTNLDGISDSEEANIMGCVDNNARGVIQTGGTSTGGIFQGNYIGTNTYFDILSSFAVPGIRDNGTAIGNLIKKNFIYNNGGGGIVLLNAASTNNTISQNSIWGNTGLGIDLVGGGVTLNDVGDIDTGTNALMNYPVISKMGLSSNNSVMLRAELDFAVGEAPYTIELFDNSEIDSSGYGEGKSYIGSVTTSNIGPAVSLSVPITGVIPTDVSKITATAKNAAGSTSEFSAVSLDSATKSVTSSASISLPNNTGNQTVPVELNAVGEFFAITEMKLSNDVGFGGSVWEPYVSSKEWELVGGNGAKTVYVKFRDSDGNESDVFSDSTVLDTTGPNGSISIKNGAEYTTSKSVLLTLSANDNDSSVSEMMLSEDPDFIGALWGGYNTTYSFELSSGDGSKTVYVKFKDAYGNVGPVVSDQIVLDSTASSAVRVKSIGLIPNIPNKSTLFYYFTAQRVRIKGVAANGDTVVFKSLLSSREYSVTARADNTFSLTIENPELPRGFVTLLYYSIDVAGNVSKKRQLKLMIGSENFPIIISDAGMEETPDRELIVSPEVTPTPEPSITMVATPVPPSEEVVVPKVSLWDRIVNFVAAVGRWFSDVF